MLLIEFSIEANFESAKSRNALLHFVVKLPGIFLMPSLVFYLKMADMTFYVICLQ